MIKRCYIGLFCMFIVLLGAFFCMYYPCQSMAEGEQVYLITPDSSKYHNDCLHPCIRYDSTSGLYFMAQSPYYGWNNKLENPMFYSSTDYKKWDNGHLISDTPERGYNSDPNICLCGNGDIQYIWRECGTPLCDSLGCTYVIVGGRVRLDGELVEKQIYCCNYSQEEDLVQAPVMVEYEGERYIYATWYQYVPERKNRGIAIWKEDTLLMKESGCRSRYQLVDTIPFASCYTVDKCAQIRLSNHIFYFPKPLYHDLWHFDLFEYADKLYMVSVAEKGDNIMLSVSKDWKKFKTFRKPLVNNHYTENYCHYRQYYYKPTAFVKDDTLHVFYTANSMHNINQNILFHVQKAIKEY